MTETRVRQKCRGRSKRTGQPCQKWPVKGHLVCRNHGAASPQAQAKAAERAVEAEVQQEMAKAIERYGITAVEDPLTALKLMAGEVLAWKDAIREHVHRLTDLRYGGEYGEQLRAEGAVFERAMDRCVSTLGVIAKLNIDDRLAAVTERQAQMLEDALFAAFDAAGLTMADVDTKRSVARAFASQLHLVG
jgi:hypothetical protein